MIVRVDLAEVAEEIIEALAVGMTFVVGHAEAPFANQAGAVAGGFQDFGNGDVVRAERLCRSIRAASVAANGGVAGMLTGHEDAAGRRADSGAGVEAGEAHAFASHAIEVGRFDFALTVRAEFTVAEIVGHDEDDVGFGCGGRGRFKVERQECGQQQE